MYNGKATPSQYNLAKISQEKGKHSDHIEANNTVYSEKKYPCI